MYMFATVFVPAVMCDKCWKKLTKDDDNRYFTCNEDADFAAETLGWHRYEQPDGDPKHICPECAEKEAMK